MKYTSEKVASKVCELQTVAKRLEDDFCSGVAIYGAGFLGAWAVDYLISLGADIRCFVDKDPKKGGTTVKDVRVIGPTDLSAYGVKSLFIASRHAVNEVVKDLGADNFIMMSFDSYFVVKNYDRLCVLRDTFLDDAKSVEVLNAILYSMLTSDLQSCYDVMDKDMYFSLPEFSGTFEETFVDAGAFVGDTVERFVWENLGTFKHIYAFEPGLKQFQAMERRVERLSSEWAFDMARVSLIRAGLSSEEGEMNCTFEDDDPIRHGLVTSDTQDINKGISKVKVCSLDSYLDGRVVSFLKVDIEGMEMDFLRGAIKTITACKPKIAICIYHYPSDLYEVAEFIKELVPEYKFKIRQHAPIFGDFVLYCHM